MSRRLLVEGDRARIEVELGDSQTADAVWEALPIQGNARLWGEEIYFPIPVSMGAESNAVEVVEVGDVCYWPAGEALCLFFGPTPASSGQEPRAASAVNVIGHVVEGLEDCARVVSSESLKVSGQER